MGEQTDSQTRGWWDGEMFRLLTKLDQTQLEDFFLHRYEPTPIFNPWGARSGYFPGSSERTARFALSAISKSSTPRLKNFRTTIDTVKIVVKEHENQKPNSPESKFAMLSRLRNLVRGSGLSWLDSVVAILDSAFERPPIWGTGGNEGSGSYTTAFLAAVIECILSDRWQASLSCSLWRTRPTRQSWDGSFFDQDHQKLGEVKGPFRQFLPGAKSTPWDLLLTFEGVLAVESGLTKRADVGDKKFLSSPFSFAPLGAGTGASSPRDEIEENQGRKKLGRGEQWFPLWSSPSTYREIRHLFREGRCSIGRRGARTPIDAAQAIRRLGSTSGITTFLRYGYLQRLNLTTHFAVPLGSLRVTESVKASLIDDLSGWWERVHKLILQKNLPEKLIHTERRLSEAIFSALTHDNHPKRWQAVLRAAVAVESLQATGTAINVGPIPELRPEWIHAIDDGSPEVRLALALGSAHAYDQEGARDTVRHHWLPLKAGGRRFLAEENRLVRDPRVVMFGRDTLRDLSALVQRRLIESSQRGQRRSRLLCAPGCGADLADLAQFVDNLLDIDKIFELARALMAVRWQQWDRSRRPGAQGSFAHPVEGWLAIRLCCLPWPLYDDRDIPADQRIVRLLSGGKSSQAIDLAISRLRIVSLRPPLTAGWTDTKSSLLWAAALAFPISKRSARRAANILDPSIQRKEVTK